MKRTLLLLGAAALLAGCASANVDPNKYAKLEIAQVTGPANVQPQAPFDVQLAVRVTNVGATPVTLRRITVRQVGPGPWTLTQNTPRTYNLTIEPGASQTVTFWMHAFANTPPGWMGSSEPVTLRATGNFDSPHGSFAQAVQRPISQFE